jgi:spore maturation protein SpmA
MLNRLWGAFILLAIATALLKTWVLGDTQVLSAMAKALFDSAKTAFEIALGLTGVLSLWLGLLKIGEAAGLMQQLARALEPLLCRLMPEVPRGHPALGSCSMNIAANMLGLDNAATPLGLKAMADLQRLNPTPDTATKAQTLFLVINTASVTLFPVTVLAYRAQFGAANPADVVIPLLIASFTATFTAVLLTGTLQRIRLADPVLWAYFLGLAGLIAGLATALLSLPAAEMPAVSARWSNSLLLLLVAVFLLAGWYKKVALYEQFILGAKEGFTTAVTLIPYLVAMLMAIALLRASGLIDSLLHALAACLAPGGWDTRWLDGLATGILKSFSGSAARASMLDVFQTQGVDSFAGRLVSILQGSSETTFYVLALYFGAVGISKAGYALALGLFADLVGFIAAVAVTYAFFT